jgi:hypothetical protein
VQTLQPEWSGNDVPDEGLWFKLRQSLLDDPPEKIKSLNRMGLEQRLIELHEQRLKELRRMLDLERQ